MIKLNYILDVTANGPNQDWSIGGGTYAAYEGVGRETDDTTYIQSGTLNDRSDFDCGNGPNPPLGFVSAVAVHYRLRATNLAGSPSILIDGLQGTSDMSLGSLVVPTTTDWIDGARRVKVDATSSLRLAPGDLDSLGIKVVVNSAPTTGRLLISRLWLEVEWTLSPEFYDPVHHGGVPSSITGDMAWSTTGTQSASVVKNQLVMVDTSTSDWRAYTRSSLEYGENYITEVSTRFDLTGGSSGFNYRVAMVDDASYAVDLCCFTDSSGDTFIGLTTVGLNHHDPDAYLATYAIDWTESHHYRLLIDRDSDPGDSLNASVFIDYSDVAAMSVNYYEFTGTTGVASIEFGTGDSSLQGNQITAALDFIDWWHYRKSGDNWRYWYTTEIGNNTVTVDSSDSDIAKPVTITPPGVTTGQSNYCAKLAVDAASLADECSVRTYWPVLSDLGTYNIALDYKMGANVENAVLQVQRTSDYYYWNNGGSSWQAAATTITVPHSASRVRTTFMSNVQTSVPDKLVIKVLNDTGAALSNEVYLYKVDVKD